MHPSGTAISAEINTAKTPTSSTPAPVEHPDELSAPEGTVAASTINVVGEPFGGAAPAPRRT